MTMHALKYLVLLAVLDLYGIIVARPAEGKQRAWGTGPVVSRRMQQVSCKQDKIWLHLLHVHDHVSPQACSP